MIVDVMLPGINGFAVCAAIRRISAVPILFLAARTDTEDVVTGLEAGADDSVVKPFVSVDLSALMLLDVRGAGAQSELAAKARATGRSAVLRGASPRAPFILRHVRCRF